jgi:hypothetical protein
MSAVVKPPIIQWKWMGAELEGCQIAPPSLAVPVPPLESSPGEAPELPPPSFAPLPELLPELADPLPEPELDPLLDAGFPPLVDPPEDDDDGSGIVSDPELDPQAGTPATRVHTASAVSWPIVSMVTARYPLPAVTRQEGRTRETCPGSGTAESQVALTQHRSAASAAAEGCRATGIASR